MSTSFNPSNFNRPIEPPYRSNNFFKIKNWRLRLIWELCDGRYKQQLAKKQKVKVKLNKIFVWINELTKNQWLRQKNTRYQFNYIPLSPDLRLIPFFFSLSGSASGPPFNLSITAKIQPAYDPALQPTLRLLGSSLPPFPAPSFPFISRVFL